MAEINLAFYPSGVPTLDGIMQEPRWVAGKTVIPYDRRIPIAVRRIVNHDTHFNFSVRPVRENRVKLKKKNPDQIDEWVIHIIQQ